MSPVPTLLLLLLLPCAGAVLVEHVGLTVSGAAFWVCPWHTGPGPLLRLLQQWLGLRL